MALPKLEKWQWTAIILCGFGLFKELRVCEPFFTPFVLEYKNITKDQVSTQSLQPSCSLSLRVSRIHANSLV